MLNSVKYFSSTLINDQYTESPEYPPFLYPVRENPKNKYENKGLRILRSKQLLLNNGYANKLKHINEIKPQYWQFIIPSYWNASSDNLSFIQYITKTKLVAELPDNYFNEEFNQNLILKGNIDINHKLLKDNIIYIYKHKKYPKSLTLININNLRTQELIKSIASICLSLCTLYNPILLNSILENDVNLEYTWYRGGYKRPKKHLKLGYWFAENTYMLYYNSKLEYNLRIENPLKEVTPIDSELSTGKVNDINYPPTHYALALRKFPYKAHPGFLPHHDSKYYFSFSKYLGRTKTDAKEAILREDAIKNAHTNPKPSFPFLSYRITNVFNTKPGISVKSSYDTEELRDQSLKDATYSLKESGYHTKAVLDKIHASSVVNSFAWLNSISHYLGYTSFNELTYPLVTQSINTDGKLWNFYLYQLNTNHLWMKDYPMDLRCQDEDYIDFVKKDNENSFDIDDSLNDRRNVCWHSKEMKLFDSIQNDQVVGYNEEILNTCLKLYLNIPNFSPQFNLNPYLHPTNETIDNYVYKY
ncbi:unnamed protein product [Gordionus sp. m RMFG-2023]